MTQKHVAIVGGGFTGLSAAYELTKLGHNVTVVERDEALGGLAGSFRLGDTWLEKFYHHWFNHDVHVMQLVEELGAANQVLLRPTRTGMYYGNKFFKLSSPLDVLRFTPLGWMDRIRLGLLVLKARAVKDWRQLEHLTAAEWLKQMAGDEVYRVVWEPLLTGKFGPYAQEISAVWFWKKLVLRGGSRGGKGAEVLAYYKGGFAALAGRLAAEIERAGGRILTGTSVDSLAVAGGRVTGIRCPEETIEADEVLLTPALPIAARLLEPHVDSAYVERLRQVKYLANICHVLILDRSLSDTYWLNVNDPSFPYVGVIEHTNFEPPTSYGGRHVVYLSKYLPETDELYRMDDDAVLDFSIEHVRRMFPEFSRDWIKQSCVWRARYAQPIVTRHYSQIVPDAQTPLEGCRIATMAQIYPEDRGTNYAIRDGRQVAREIADAPGIPVENRYAA